ncbi:hypothetical protein FHR71_005523 [Methylobacterium sp. RAS18]|nr:hypothetical protein [Methylobacterium sp. RAS18]
MAFASDSTFAPELHGPVTRAIRAMRTEPEPQRRGFLQALAALPLIGGAVSLTGSPSAVAEPITRDLLLAYSEWLRVERNRVHVELWPDEDPSLVAMSALPVALDRGKLFYVPQLPADAYGERAASTRAALVLSAVGCDWRR